MRCTYPLASARIRLLRLQIDLAGYDLGAAEIDQRENDVIARGQPRGEIDREFADRTRESREFGDRHLLRNRVVEATELEMALGDEVRAAAVAEADSDLAFRWRNVLDGHVLDCRIALEAGWRDIDFHAGAEDVLKRISAGDGALRNFLHEENVPAFLTECRCPLHREADDPRRPRLDAYRGWRCGKKRSARCASAARRQKAIVAVFGAVPVLTGNRRLNRLIRSIGQREAGSYASSPRGGNHHLEWVDEQLRADRRRNQEAKSAKGECGSPHPPFARFARPGGRARAGVIHEFSYGAERVKTIGRLYVPSALLALEKSFDQVVLKKDDAPSPFVAPAPEAKVTSLAVIGVYVPPAVVAQARSPIGLRPELLPT